MDKSTRKKSSLNDRVNILFMRSITLCYFWMESVLFLITGEFLYKHERAVILMRSSIETMRHKYTTP